MSQDIPVTTAVRFLRSNNIDFEGYQYKYEEKGGTRHTAEVMQVDEHKVIKTLIFDADNELIIVLMHGDREVSTKELARQIGVKKAQPADAKKAMNATGYQFGGTSPYGTKKKMDIFAEESIFGLPEIYINGGKRGFIVKLNIEEFKKSLDFNLVNVAI